MQDGQAAHRALCPKESLLWHEGTLPGVLALSTGHYPDSCPERYHSLPIPPAPVLKWGVYCKVLGATHLSPGCPLGVAGVHG